MLQVLESPSLDPTTFPAAESEPLSSNIPSAFNKCHYCDFYSITRQEPARMERFVDLVLREAELWTNATQLSIQPRTIFFGGGTPTLLPIDAMRRLLAGLRDRFDLSDVNEWTVEAN